MKTIKKIVKFLVCKNCTMPNFKNIDKMNSTIAFLKISKVISLSISFDPETKLAYMTICNKMIRDFENKFEFEKQLHRVLWYKFDEMLELDYATSLRHAINDFEKAFSSEKTIIEVMKARYSNLIEEKKSMTKSIITGSIFEDNIFNL
jgi:hypothetical protein